MRYKYILDVKVFNYQTEKKCGIDILLLSFLKFGVEISQGEHPKSYDILLINLGIWKLYFSFQIFIDWRK